METLRKLTILMLTLTVVCCLQLNDCNKYVSYGSVGNSAVEKSSSVDNTQEQSLPGDTQNPPLPDDTQESESEDTQNPPSSDDTQESEPEDTQNPPSSGEEPNTGSENSSSRPSTGSTSSGTSGNANSGSNASGTSSSNSSPPAGVLSSNNVTSNQGSLSTDTRLSELRINCGLLIPEFSPDQYNYIVYVEYDGQPIDCGTSAVGVDPFVRISAEGPLETNGDDVQKRVIAEAEDGSKSEYIIDIHVVKENEVLVDNILYTISDPHNIDSLPGDFYETEIEFVSQTVKAAQSSDGNLCLLCFANTADQDDVLWYFFNEDTGDLYPAEILDYNGHKYLGLSDSKEFVYGEYDNVVGYFLIDTDTGEILLSLNENKSIAQDDTDGPSVSTIFAICSVIVVVIAIGCCVFFYRRIRLNAKKNSEQGKKYFRPYLSPDEEYMAEISNTKKSVD